MKYQFEESGFTDKNYLPLSPNFRRNPKVFWVYHDNDCIPKWKNPGEAVGGEYELRPDKIL